MSLTKPDTEVQSHCFCFLHFTVLHSSQEEVTVLYQQKKKNRKNTARSNILHRMKKTPHSLILACLGWKNAALLEVRRSNGHLINLSCLSLLTTILPVTPFNSLMTLLSVRLRRTESKYDLIKRSPYV